MKGWGEMTSEELELVDLTNQQYKKLLVMQGKAYKKVLNLYKEYISDLEKIKVINQNMAVIDTTILTELEDMRKHNKLLIKSCK